MNHQLPPLSQEVETQYRVVMSPIVLICLKEKWDYGERTECGRKRAKFRVNNGEYNSVVQVFIVIKLPVFSGNPSPGKRFTLFLSFLFYIKNILSHCRVQQLKCLPSYFRGANVAAGLSWSCRDSLFTYVTHTHADTHAHSVVLLQPKLENILYSICTKIAFRNTWSYLPGDN